MAAASLRDAWISTAESGKFIVIAPEASGSLGGWVPGMDYFLFQDILDEVTAHYNIDHSRIYGWGFSSGGHVMHDLALHRYTPYMIPDNRAFAAYGVSAGVLPALLCNGSELPFCSTFLPHVSHKLPVHLLIGTSDSYWNYVMADYNAFQAAGWSAGNTVKFQSFADGHVIDPGQFPSVWQFFCPWQRRSIP